MKVHLNDSHHIIIADSLHWHIGSGGTSRYIAAMNDIKCISMNTVDGIELISGK